MPTSAKTPDQRSDRYFGTSKWPHAYETSVALVAPQRHPPAIVKLGENVWEEFTPFLRFDTEIRRIVRTTNAIWVLYSYHCLGSCSPQAVYEAVRPDSERD
ncbi:hypothetical protein GCM10010307_08090 [Streptomyces vastus]|uniref:Uncharacterized protein n=1 Tax=Streptomyces vastus TaxID=285451 RepID=A0ABP6CTH7_9ACTN